MGIGIIEFDRAQFVRALTRVVKKPSPPVGFGPAMTEVQFNQTGNVAIAGSGPVLRGGRASSARCLHRLHRKQGRRERRCIQSDGSTGVGASPAKNPCKARTTRPARVPVIHRRRSRSVEATRRRLTKKGVVKITR
jgi:hypothetical protein